MSETGFVFPSAQLAVDNLDAVRSLLGSALPVRGPACHLALAAAPSGAIELRADGELIASLKLTVLDHDGSVWDEKEQQVPLASPKDVQDLPRLQAYLRGWLRTLPTFLEGPDVELLMPHDLVFQEALAEKDLQTEDDFSVAFAGPNSRVSLWREAREEQEFRWQIDQYSLTPHADALRQLYRPSIRIESTRVEGTIPIGTSRLGGLPDLPLSLLWPRWGKDAFDFIGQLNLVELQRAAPKEAAVLPSTGILYFFFALAIRGGALEDPEWRGGGRVLYFPGDVADLKVGSLPPDVEPYRVLSPRTATFRREGPALPPCESPYYPVLLGGGGYNDALSRAAETFGPLLEALGVAPPLGSEDDDRPRQRVLGYGDPLQSNPNVNCEGYSSGRVPGNWADAPDFWNRAAEWQLLFQADSEYGKPDVMLGDEGRLYFMIRPTDLAERRFDAVWTDWQSH